MFLLCVCVCVCVCVRACVRACVRVCERKKEIIKIAPCINVPKNKLFYFINTVTRKLIIKFLCSSVIFIM